MRNREFVASVLVCGVLAGGFTGGCSEKASPPVVEKTTPAQPSEPSPALSESAQREKVVREMMMWPSDGTASRDVVADYHTCLGAMNGSPKLRALQGLAQFAWMRDCLVDKGWQVNPDAQVQPVQP